MARANRLAVVFAVCHMFVTVIAENSYLFVAPKSIRPGTNFVIQGSILTPTTIPVDVTVTLEIGKPRRFPFRRFDPLPLVDGGSAPAGKGANATEPEPLSTALVTFTDSQTKDIILRIPDNLPDKSYDLKIRGRGGLTFENSTQLDYEGKTLSIYIQTDKAIYKPGQTVHFRIFGVNSDLKVQFEDVKVEVYDPNGNKISQWSVTQTQMRKDAGGIFENQLWMSESPILGVWKIKVLMGNEKEEKPFTVDEYVLPKFEVDIDLPSFGRTDEELFEGKIQAKYTFGKPVKGTVQLRIKPEWPRFKWINGTRTKIVQEIELQFNIDGTATFTVPMKDLRERVQKWLNGNKLLFEANVTETLTGFKISDDAKLTFYDNPIKMEFPSSSPSSFKPGMDYLAVLKIAEQDDTPPTVLKGKVKMNVTYFRPMTTTTSTTTTTTTTTTQAPKPVLIDGVLVTKLPPPPVLEIIERRHFPGGWWWPRDEEFIQPEITVTVPIDGIVEIPLTIPSDVKRVSLRANYNGITAYKSLSKAHSPSESYIQLKLVNDKPKSGYVANVAIRSAGTQGEATYQVLSKGNIVTSGKVSISDGVLQFLVTSNMAPKAKLIVYLVKADGEVVADALTFNVQGIFKNNVAIDFNMTQALPGANIKLSVRADPGSKVNVLAVDKSVLLLKSGNDITTDQVRTELQSYDPTDKFSVCDWFCWRWPMSSGGTDASQVFKKSGVVYITDANVYQHQEDVWSGPMPMLRGGVAFSAMADSVGGSPPMLEEGNISPPANLKPVQRIRKLFPETWLWNSKETTQSGLAEFESIVPDTITSWVATAFAVNPETGLGLSESAANLRTFKSFFVSLHMPYSVVRGEKVIVQANIFNYSPDPVFCMVRLMRNPDYENIHIFFWAQTSYSATITRFARVPPNGVKAVYFPIIPKKIGKIDLHVSAQSLYDADAIQKPLLVEAEGTPQEYNVPVLIDLKDRTEFPGVSVPISFPQFTVKDSERLRVTAIGDLMGPSINGLDALLKMPYGCGEQNMLNFAPNIYITKYLEVTNNLNDATLEKSRRFMVKGYQKELTYQHDDGSFSAFGNSDPSGSMWLSAFVLKSFVQAKPYIFIDDAVLHKTINWIIKYQNKNGTFQEPGKVLHKEMQGGSAGEGSLTSFVLAALLEARVVEGVNANISEAVSKSLAYLEAEVMHLTDVYEIAIISYVLNLAGSTKAPEVMAKLETLATNEDGMKYWAKADKKAVVEHSHWDRRQGKGKAINIELTAYALLSLAATKNRAEGLQVLKWLTSQRNPNGGYSSTQDTVVALQALAEMAAQVYSKNFNMTVTVSGPVESGITEMFDINPENALVLQSRDLPSNIGSVTVTASGQGLGLIEVAAFYNVNKDDKKPSFYLKTTVLEETKNYFKVEVCTRWLEEGSSGMSVMEIGTPSGFSADKSTVSKHRMLKRVEDGDRKVILYIDEIQKEEMCYTVAMERTGLVAGAQPVPVKVYDYYEPTNKITDFFVPEALRKSDVCGICPKEECEFCRNNRRWLGRF